MRATRQQPAPEAAQLEAVREVLAAAIQGDLETTEIPEMAEMPEITETLKIQTSRRWFRW